MLPVLRSLVLAVVVVSCPAAFAAAESSMIPVDLDAAIARAVEHMFGAAVGEGQRAAPDAGSVVLSRTEVSRLEQERQAAAAAVATAAAQQRAAEAREALLAQRIDTMERLLLAQHEREIALYRDTIRLVTLVGGAFAGVCMIGLFAAAFLNYRALVTVQNMSSRVQELRPDERAPALLASTTEAGGMDRVRVSGRRFQSRMSSLEQRLAELEHLAGRPSTSSTADGGMDDEVQGAPTATNFVPPPPTQVIPRALILVHKAQALMNLGKLNDALATLDEAEKFDATKPEVHLARGQVLEKMGRLGDALKAYDAAVVSDEQNASALLLKAGVLNRQERFTEALACYERALEVHRATT